MHALEKAPAEQWAIEFLAKADHAHLTAAGLLAHPASLLFEQTAYQALTRISLRGAPTASPDEWHLMHRCKATVIQAERSLQ